MKYLGFLLAGCIALTSCDWGLTVHEDMFERERAGEEFRYLGRACYPLRDNGTSSTGFWDAHIKRETSEENGVVSVRITGRGGEVLAERKYDEAFARSGVTDEVTVTLSQDREYRFRYRGGDPCYAGD